MFGRQVTVPTTINRVLTDGPIEMELVYLIAPDKLAGLSFTFNGKPALVPDKYSSLPVVGGWFGTQTGNYETFIAAKPDIILEGTKSSIRRKTGEIRQYPGGGRLGWYRRIQLCKTILDPVRERNPFPG